MQDGSKDLAATRQELVNVLRARRWQDQGLGRAMGEYLAAKGAKIALIDLMPEKLDEAVTACVAAGAEARSYVCNVAKEEDVEKTFEAIVKDFGHLNGLVNNAGILRDGLMVKVKDGEVERATKLPKHTLNTSASQNH